eukprot:TRINITY_DN11721_c0_g1_i2.p1 TRINITY_DN11721_c0_g1~~TRINITY_DN11721_c0_g1_i2.p1  ORF type:complete len:380 (+),score=62.18 TRINITY_DN11721_c0_g1_i2:106-1245(+)
MEEGRKVILAIDESSACSHALRWSAEHILRVADQVHLVNVLPPIAYSVSPAAPIATGSAVAAVTQTWEAQKQHDSEVSLNTLQKAKEIVETSFKDSTVSQDERNEEREEQGQGLRISVHQIPATGGASGVAESIVTFCKTMKADLLIMGSRGMGSFQRSIMGLVGLGSVSHYCAHHLNMPVLIIRGDETPVQAQETTVQPEPLQVMFAMDESERSIEALSWLCENIIRENDVLHITSVALPSPFLVADGAGPEWIHQATTAEEVRAWEQDKQSKKSHTEKCCRLGIQLAQERSAISDTERILGRALQPEGGASDVAGSLCHYANDNKVQLVVVGARHMGDVKRSVMNIIGLGSVSDYCVNNLHCPALLYKYSESDIKDR